MFVKMIETTNVPHETFTKNQVYDFSDIEANLFIRMGKAVETSETPKYVTEMLQRLNEGKDGPVVFLPFIGEFGNLIWTHIRIVHWHKSKEKIVCCKPGQEALFPSAYAFFTNWQDSTPDTMLIGSGGGIPQNWNSIEDRFKGYRCLTSGRLLPRQEVYLINRKERIKFSPKISGIYADVVIGIRKRQWGSHKNWNHWQIVADGLSKKGISFAVIGDKATSFNLNGQICHTDGNCDLAIELLKSCKLYVGTDTGSSHLAATVGTKMLVFRELHPDDQDRLPMMDELNNGNVERLYDVWNNPEKITKIIVEKINNS